MNVIELAKQAGIEFQEHVGIGGMINVSTRGSQPIGKIETLIKLVRNAAFEEAAQIHDKYGDIQSTVSRTIRNLKDSA